MNVAGIPAQGVATRSALREITRSVPNASPSTSNILSQVAEPMHAASPDEEVVRKRGKRTASSLSSVLTPPRTPTKRAHSPRKLHCTPRKTLTSAKGLSAPTRSSPRKRLLLPSDIADVISSSPSKRLVAPFKQLKLQLKEQDVEPTTALTSLTKSQLVSLFEEMMTRFPNVQRTIGDLIPAPDLSHADQKLDTLLRSVFRSFPQKHWGNSRDAFCYRRVQQSLEAFKEKCMSKARQLSQGRQWGALLEYVVLAWSFVQRLPDWDDPSHNKVKLTCFRSLAAHCMTALKNGTHLEAAHLHSMTSRLREMKEDNCCIMPCLKFAEAALLNRQCFRSSH